MSVENDKLRLVSEELLDFNFDKIVSWQFELRFLALLHTDLEGDVEIKFDMSDCYDSNSLLTTLNVEQVCVYNYRNVELSSYIINGSIAPNVVGNEANLTVNTSD